MEQTKLPQNHKFCHPGEVWSWRSASKLASRRHGQNGVDQALSLLLAALTWATICMFLRILLLLPWPKANVPGAYLFGFRQNVGNYIGANGRSVRNLLLRIPSVFEKPSLIPQYLKAMIRNERLKGFKLVTPTQSSIKSLSLSHGVCRNRNVYIPDYNDSPPPPSNAPIVIYKGAVIEGHHRYMAGVRTGIVEIHPEEY